MTHFFEKRDRWGHGRALWILTAMVFLVPLAWSSVKRIHLENDVENWLPSNDPQGTTLSWYRDHFPIEDRILISWEGSSLGDPRVRQFAEKLEGTPDADGIRRNGLPQVKSAATPHDVLARMVKYNVEPEEAVRRLEGVLLGTGTLKVRLTDAGRHRKERTIALLEDQAKSELGLEINVSQPETEPIAEEVAEVADAEQKVGSRIPQNSGDAGNVRKEVSVADSEGEEDRSGIENNRQPILPAWRPHDFQIGWRGMHQDEKRREQVRQFVLGLRDRSRIPKNSGDNSGGAPQVRILGNSATAKSAADLSEGEPLVAECFFLPGSPAALSVDLSEAGMADRSETFRAIRQAAVEVGIPEVTLRMGGRPVAGAALNEAVKQSAWNRDYPLTQFHKRSPLLLSCLVSVGLSFFMLGSFRLATLVQIVAFYATFVTLALVPATGGNMNMVLVVMPTLLLVLTISASIHVSNYWKNAAFKNMRTAVVEAMAMARQPCALASVTTAIGLASLATSPLAPVRDFGLYSAAGCLISLIVVLYGLPALLQFWPAKPPKESEIDRTAWRTLGLFLSRHSTRVSLTCVVVFTLCAGGLKWFRTETKVIRYFPDDARVVVDYNFLEEKLSGIVPVDTVVRFNQQAQGEMNFVERLEVVRRIEDKMRRHPEISGAISLADFQPVSAAPPANASFIVKARYNRRASAMEARIREGEQSGTRSFLTVAQQPADLVMPGDQKLNQAGDELWRITAQVAIMSDLDYGDLTRDLDEIAQSELKFHPGAGHVVTGMVPLFLRTQQAVLESLIRSFGLAFVIIAVVMMVLLKSPLAGLLVMLPNLLPVGMIFGLISWYGLRVDIGTMITASVALGIAVDGTLHLLTWFRAGVREGLPRRKAVANALAHCGPAMWQTSAAVGLGLVVLYFADLLLISRFGWLMAALIGSALVADIIFLPALLAGPLGALIEKSVERPVACPDPTPAAQPAANSLKPHLPAAPSHPDRILRVD